MMSDTPIPMSEPVKKMFDEAVKNNPLPIEEAEVRNIIIVGKIRSGKSTVLNMLRNPIHLAGNLSLFTDTLQPQLHSVSVKNSNGKNYVLNIIDTPGLFESYEKGKQGQMRDNKTIKQMIKKCMQHEIKKIHAIFFVCSFETGVDQQQIDAFIEFCDMFKSAEDKIAMIIGRSEHLDAEKKIKLIEEIKNAPRLADLLKRIGGTSQIFFSGCVPKKEVERGWLETVETKAKNVFHMRKKIYNFLFEKSHQPAELRSLNELSYYGEIVVSTANKFVENVSELSQIVSKKDYKEISSFTLNLNLLKCDVEDDLVFFKDEKVKGSFNESCDKFFNILKDHDTRKGILQELIKEYNTKKTLMGSDRLRHIRETARFISELSDKPEEGEEFKKMYREFAIANKFEVFRSTETSGDTSGTVVHNV